MADNLELLQPIHNSVSKTTMRQLSRITLAMIAMTGCVTMLGISRWTKKGGSYRIVQRFFSTVIPWAQVFWAFFRTHLFVRQDTCLLAGNESVVAKAGKRTHGIDYFFSNLQKNAVPGLSFFTLSLVIIQQRRSYRLRVEQQIRTEAEKAETQASKPALTRCNCFIPISPAVERGHSAQNQSGNPCLDERPSIFQRLGAIL